MRHSRRTFLQSLTALSAAGLARASAAEEPPSSLRGLRPGASERGFDPWLEIDAAAVRRNVRESARLAGGRPILAVVKNNAYGLGDELLGGSLRHRLRAGARGPDAWFRIGAPGRARTYGLQIRSLALYPTELRARTLRNSNPTIRGRKTRWQIFRFRVGWVMGLEPTTPGATVQCSTIELHPP